jgi:hypothetical protein
MESDVGRMLGILSIIFIAYWGAIILYSMLVALYKHRHGFKWKLDPMCTLFIGAFLLLIFIGWGI